ncbi:hypothetical protein D5F01_LYC08888 [Larimichthys crocea]|uniref:LINE-1 type transposase domain-containing protein 1 n=1 Tax=Larimichthys crocea TaxID=215358 RepID=A0A6G0IJ44_LARCR|nr:hypothetical protein D5F01_LYC08888 [Larimichthys crocea]
MSDDTCLSEIASLNTRMTEAEGCISNSEDATATFTMKLSEVESKLETALDKINDLENRSRRCNICVVGLPEGSEGTNPVAFFRTWLPELLEINAKGGSVKLYNFQDKVWIMQAARKAQSLAYNGAPIMVFGDFSAAVIRKRQEYYVVKQQLKERGIVFAMMYPAVLRIKHNGQEKVFKHPKEVSAFMDKESQRGGSPSTLPDE